MYSDKKEAITTISHISLLITHPLGVQQNIPIDVIKLTPGIPPEKDIVRSEITTPVSLLFNLYGDRSKLPLPMGMINNQPFDDQRVDIEVSPGQGVEITVVNPNGGPHPFHIHINRFQVISMSSGSIFNDELLNNPLRVWRDTIIIPGLGVGRLWMRVGNRTGKTLFHCHKLFHEDSGMAGTILIRNPPTPQGESPAGLVWWFPWALAGGLGLLSLILIVVLIGTRWSCKKKSKRPDYKQIIDTEEHKLVDTK